MVVDLLCRKSTRASACGRLPHLPSRASSSRLRAALPQNGSPGGTCAGSVRRLCRSSWPPLRAAATQPNVQTLGLGLHRVQCLESAWRQTPRVLAARMASDPERLTETRRAHGVRLRETDRMNQTHRLRWVVSSCPRSRYPWDYRVPDPWKWIILPRRNIPMVSPMPHLTYFGGTVSHSACWNLRF